MTPFARRALAALTLCLPGAVLAQAYPTKPVKMVIPFAAAGPADLVGRVAAQKFADILGQPFVIDNRGGAGGNVGAGVVAKSPADGYTILLTTSAFAVNVTLAPNGGFDAEKEFVPVGVIAKQPNLIFVHPGVPAKNLAELLAYAKGKKLAYATPGTGTTPHLTAENLFNVMNKLEMTAIHFRGAGPAITAVVGGEPVVGSGALSTPLPHVKSGKLRALAVSSAKRMTALPDVPTFAEAGIAGVTDETWIGVFAPTGTPAAVITRLNEAINQMIAQPDMRERLAAMAFDPVGGNPREFADYVKTEIVKWGKVVKAGDIKPE